MRRSLLGRFVPALLTIVGVTIPSVTAADVMLYAMTAGTAAEGGAPASTPASSAPAPATSTTLPSATATPTSKTQPAATATPGPTKTTTRTITGPAVADRYGEVQATITVSGGKITNVSISAPEDDPRSAAINQQAVPLLESETLQAQSGNVNLISGATITSETYIQSLQGALQTAGLS